MKIFLCITLIFAVLSKVQNRSFGDVASVDKIIEAMTIEQLIGQTTQVDLISLNDNEGITKYNLIKEYNLGSVLVGGDGCPDADANINNTGDCMQANNAQWKQVADNSNAQAVEVTLKDDQDVEYQVKIKVLLGTDAVHGNQHSVGEILFPHNIGLAASFNPENFRNSARWNRDSVLEGGFNFIFSPTVAVSHNPQWGRFYETMGVNPDLIKQYAKAYVEASQNIIQGTQEISGVLTSVKHFLGDGATLNGYEEGNSAVDAASEQTFIDHNSLGYEGAIEAGTGNVMVSYDAIEGVPMSIHPWVNSLLKTKLGFEGFVISDYNSVIKTSEQGLPTTPIKMPIEEAYTLSFNNGVDMQMLSGGATDYQTLIKKLVEEDKTIDIIRIKDAVKRILLIKDRMGLIEYPDTIAKKYNKPQRKQPIILKDKQEEYNDALQAALQSLVLLTNSNDVLPVKREGIQNIVIIGDRYLPVGNGKYRMFQDYDNIGAQNGGWTIRWQGYNGNDYWTGQLKLDTKASSILDAIKTRFGDDVNIYYPNYNDPTSYDQILIDRNAFRNTLINKQTSFTNENTIIINVLAENPYAEFMGDVNCEYCKTVDKVGCLYANSHMNEYQPKTQATSLEIKIEAYEKSIINLVKGNANKIPVITVLFSGRPMIISQPLSLSQAFIAAWLPGTTGGEAVVQAIFGEYGFRENGMSNKLPAPWIQDMYSIKDFPTYKDGVLPSIEDPLYDTGHGEETKAFTKFKQ